jgi:hypothetical protein
VLTQIWSQHATQTAGYGTHRSAHGTPGVRTYRMCRSLAEPSADLLIGPVCLLSMCARRAVASRKCSCRLMARSVSSSRRGPATVRLLTKRTIRCLCSAPVAVSLCVVVVLSCHVLCECCARRWLLSSAQLNPSIIAVSSLARSPARLHSTSVVFVIPLPSAFVRARRSQRINKISAK